MLLHQMFIVAKYRGHLIQALHKGKFYAIETISSDGHALLVGLGQPYLKLHRAECACAHVECRLTDDSDKRLHQVGTEYLIERDAYLLKPHLADMRSAFPTLKLYTARDVRLVNEHPYALIAAYREFKDPVTDLLMIAGFVVKGNGSIGYAEVEAWRYQEVSETTLDLLKIKD